jgi:type IV pilus assembly protein PilQ
MSTKGRINARRLSSFLIYPVSAIWLLSGCATKSSLNDTSVTVHDDPASQIEQVAKNPLPSNAELKIIPVSDKISSEKPDITQQPEEKYVASEPRIMIEPSKSDQDQILGIDFTMLEQGKSRLTITTNNEVTYDLDRKGKNALSLNLYDVSIPPSVLLRKIDTTHFQSALDRVKPVYSKEKKSLSIGLSLREMVPFHIKQTDKGLTMDFGPTSVKAPDTKIIPLNLAEIETKKMAANQQQTVDVKTGEVMNSGAGKSLTFTDEPMESLEFFNEDVTNILKLMNKVTKENIIFDDAIKGIKVNLILKDVPWNEAMELILRNYGLAKRYVGKNIVWITTKQKMAQILADEEAEARKLEQKLEEERQRLQDQKKKAEEDAPLITEYLPVDFASASEIKGHINTTNRGSMSIDSRTNTIIITDTAESIEAAKKTVKQFDTPVKQIMIEARIVDASDNFSRDLGLRWNSTTSFSRSDDNGNTYGGTFSTNNPSGWAPNIGLSFSRLTSSGNGSIALNASLALAESQGTAKTLSAPKVIAQEGASARIVSGETIYTNPTENVAQTSRDAALTLDVTPTSISYNGFISMTLNVTDNKNVSPTLDTTKAITTTLMVKSGETIVIGGIIKETESDDATGVPILKDIPGLGWLFKANTKTRVKSELLIFLTPTVLPAPEKSF